MSNKLKKYFKGDHVIWGVIIMLFIFSLLTVYSATATLASKYKGDDTTFYLFRHLKFLIVGLVVIFVVHRVNYKYFARFAHILYVVSIPLLFITLVMGVTRNEASRWLEVFGVEFQTSDFAKFALIMYIARILSISQNSKSELYKAFKPIMIAVGAICGLILPANFSTAALLFGTSFVLMFIGRVDFRQLTKAVAIVGVGALLFIIVAQSVSDSSRVGTWQKRIQSYVSGESGDNYQVTQAKIAISTGGFFGKMPGNSTQRNFIPHPYSDFIFAIVIEEYGALGGMVVVFLYMFLLYRAGMIVRASTRTFPAFLAIGLTLNMVFQALLNMAVAVNLIPVTGQPLPFISMGGTSIIFTSIAFGMILSISRSIEKEKSAAKKTAKRQPVAA